jgi:hypothetical protein
VGHYRLAVISISSVASTCSGALQSAAASWVWISLGVGRRMVRWVEVRRRMVVDRPYGQAK